MVESKSVFQMVKAQNFIYEDLHVFVFALSKFDAVRYDYFEAVRGAVGKERQGIAGRTPRGPKRQAALKAFEGTKSHFESERLNEYMTKGTDQRMSDLNAVVNDAAQAIDYALNTLGCVPTNVHLFALPEDQQKIKDLLVDEDAGLNKDQMLQKPDEHVQMRWRTTVKARYDFMYENCLTEEERQQVRNDSQLSYHEPTIAEWEKTFKQVLENANKNMTADGFKQKKTLFMQFFAGHGMTYNGEQVLLGNEYDEKNEWYKFLKVEQSVRTAANFNQHVYFFTVFACCREKYMPKNNENRDEAQHRGISKDFMEENKTSTAKALKEKREAETATAGGPDDEVEEEVTALPEARGGTITGVASTKTVNFCFVFGCSPGAGVLAKTQLIRDLTDHLKQSKQCIIPQVFDSIESQDAGFETIASNMGQNLEIVSVPELVGQMTCIYVQYKKRNAERERQKAEAMRFCKESLQMESEDIIVLDNEEMLWFYHQIWGDKPPQALYKYSDLQSWQAYYKLPSLDISDQQQEKTRQKLAKLAHRVFIEKKRVGSQWFRFAFMESYRHQIGLQEMEQELLEHGIYQIQQWFMQQSYDVIYTFHHEKASFVPYIETMNKLRDSRASGDILCKQDFWQYNNSKSDSISFENTKANCGHYSYTLRNKKKIFERGEAIFNQSSSSLKDEFQLRSKCPTKCFPISDLRKLEQNRQLLVTQITEFHSLCITRVDKDEGKAVIGLRLNNKQFPYRNVDYIELDANFTQASFTLRKFFVSSDNQYALIGNINYAYKPGATTHHWQTTVVRISVENNKLKAVVLSPIEIFDIYQLDVYPCASKDQKRVFMPYICRGNGGAPDGAASYSDELQVEVFEYNLESDQITKIHERFALQSIFLKDEFYMKKLRDNGWEKEGIPMRMSKGSIVQMKNFNDHHFCYFDMTDNWMSFAEFPFLIDWKIDNNGNFQTFSWQEINSEVAVGVQRLSDPKHKSIISVNMFDPFSLSVTLYIDNSCIPFTSTHGKTLTKVEKRDHLPTDAAFYSMPGYDRMHFPFVMMEVASKGEIYILNTKTWFQQLLIKMVKDHNQDCIGQYFFTYERKPAEVTTSGLQGLGAALKMAKAANKGDPDAGAPSKLYLTSHKVNIEDVQSICLNYIEQNVSKDGEEQVITFNQFHFGPDLLACLTTSGYMPPAHGIEFQSLMKDCAELLKYQ